MNLKNNRFAIGTLLAIIGILTFLFIGPSFPITMLLAIALFILYLSKEKTWALVCGSILVIACASPVFGLLPFVGREFIKGILFLVPGIILLCNYRIKHKENLLIPGCFMLWGGIYMILMQIHVFTNIAGVLFFYCLGLFFLTLEIISKQTIGLWSVGAAIVCFIVGNLLIAKQYPLFPHLSMITYGGGIIFLLLSAIFFIKNTKKKQ